MLSRGTPGPQPFPFLALAFAAGAGCAAGSTIGQGGSSGVTASGGGGSFVTTSFVTSTSSTTSDTTSSSSSTSTTSSSSTTSSTTSSSSSSSSSTSSSSSSSSSTSSSTTTSSSSSSSSSTSSSSSSSSGGTGGVVVMLAGGGSSIIGGEWHGSGSWVWSTISDATTYAPAIALSSAGTAVGLIRSNANAGELRYTTWTPGNWAQFLPLGAAVTTRAAPSIAAVGSGAQAVFHGDNNKHYYAAYAGSWSPAAEAVMGGSVQSFGPSPASIATVGTDAVIAYAGNDNDVYDQTRTSGAWASGHGHALGAVTVLTPALVAFGSDLLLVYVHSGTDPHVYFTTRTSGAWSAPAQVHVNAMSNESVSLAAIPGGGAVMAYRGQDGKAYWSRFNSGAWSTPAAVASPNPSVPAAPAVAPGIAGADAEMIFVDAATHAANHTRLTGTTWSAPVTVAGTDLTRCAVASY